MNKSIELYLTVFSKFLLIGYVLLVLYCTVFIKELSPNYSYDYHLFWSYKADGDGSFYFKENMLNALLYLPLGFLLPFAFKRVKWWQVTLFALFLSVSVEFIQLLFKCGFSELDDVFHNTLGCVIGFFLYKGIIAVYKEKKI